METVDLEQRKQRQASFSRARSWSIAFHVGLSSFALLLVVGMLNYLAHRHDRRIYVSDPAAHKLTPFTLQVLSGLSTNVKVTVFYDRRESFFGAVSSLLKEYQTHSPKIDLEFVDYRMPGRADAIRTQYKLTADADSSRVIFDSGGQVRTVPSTELSEYGVTSKKEFVRTGFRGEQLFTSAILNVTKTKPMLGYFLQGHGEHHLMDDDQQGYSRFGRLMENNNITLQTVLPLIGSNSIPPECGLIMIAGPTHRFEPEEIAKLDQFLGQGGRLFVLFNGTSFAPTGLEQLLYKWNVQVGFDRLRDSSHSEANNPNVIIVSNFGTHQIVRSLLRSTIKMVIPRSIVQRQSSQNAPDAPKVTELLYTSQDGQELVLNENGTWRELGRGALPLAVAGERGAIQGVKTEKGSTRFVVVGDSLFLSNLAFNHAANSDFADVAVNWLANRDTLLNEIRASPVSEYQISLTEQQMSQLRWLFLGAIPGVVVIFGFFVWLRRRV
jgi:hypothetical protein